MRDEEEATDGPPDPQLHPENSPGFGEEPVGLEDIEVSREDVTIGEADPAELSASDTEPVEDAAERDLLASLAGDGPIERRRAALALAERDASDAAIEGLAAAAATDDEPEVRQFAVEALGKLGGEIAEQTARKLLSDPEPWVRAEALVSLDRLDRASHEDAIEAALEDPHHAVRRNAAISLFKLRGEGAKDLLLAQTDDPSERVREWAAHLLAGVDDDVARERLRELADDDDSDIVRRTAARAHDADPGAFRRQFSGTLDEVDTTLPGEDRLNRRPDL
ncbi:HEAT repeat domain-containing protein [Haloarchaeobius amylolyticus]|uniref:HEAT repeat domain-containing protein n=1 Tax=Haloarchaeobius amylolyticus TaxID=1198296 RepID=UPI00226DD94E|nr:HEAT repeat domain-containing protein [Haloarchaeobius amylolyticus]